MKHRKIVSRRHQRNRLWAISIFGLAEFGDQRRSLRATSFLAQKATRPADGILRASGDSAAAKGNYRLLENTAVTAAQFWNPIHQHTARSLHGLERVYIIQDTTLLLFPGLEATKGLGTAGKAKEEALLLHSALAIRPDGQVVGLIHNHVWARPLAEFGLSRQRQRAPIEEKESYEWIRGMDRATQLRAEHSPHTKILHIFDRGGDVHEVLAKIVGSGDDCVIRSARDRKVAGPHEYLRGTLAAQPLRDSYEIEAPRKRGRPKRQAQVEVRSARVTLTPPPNYPTRRPLTINLVWVHEPHPPAGVQALDWLLLTTLPIDTVEQCREVIAIYKCRWVIEDFHLTLKSGCGIEKTQLKTAGRIEAFLAVLCAVAVRILQLRNWARTEPQAPCTLVLAEDEWKVLWAHVHGRPVSQAHSPPTMAQAVRMIGRLGGHLGRKGDGMPGVRTLWWGWRDLQLMVEGFHLNAQW